MKRFYLFILLLVSMSSLAQRQNDLGQNKNGKEKIRALYAAFMNQELMLNETEAQRFWAVYYEYEMELKNAHRSFTSELEKEEKVLTVRKKFEYRFIKIIGRERTNNFFRKDKEFKNKMIDNLRDRIINKKERP